MTGGDPRVFTIPPGAAFLDTLADALLDGTLVPGFSRAARPLGLAAATIYLPTRRSARALAAVIAAKLGTGAALLPRIVPLGALDDAEVLLEEGGIEDGFDPDLPSAIGDIHRRMILTRLVLAWGKAVRHAIVSVDADGRRILAETESLLVATSAADAWHLAGDLTRLIDEMTIEEVGWSAATALGTEDFDRYWRITLDFLGVAMNRYPAILAELGKVDRAERQRRLIEAEAGRLAAGRHDGPVVVAGSTGSNRATATLIAAVSRMPQGAVVLPGLDLALDDRSWACLAGDDADRSEAGHPQHALRELIATIGVERREVVELGGGTPAKALRGRLVGEALRPAETTEAWRHLAIDTRAALEGVTLIEAADEREEALAIAVSLREALEGGGTAALVTPDRTIARRVRAELTRWGIDIEDSSGEPLGQTSAGILARLVIDVVREAFAPVEILALLQHPDVRLGRPRREVLRLARRLDEQLRGVLPPDARREPAAFMARVAAGSESAKAHEIRTIAALLEDLEEVLRPLRVCGRMAALPAWIEAHEKGLAGLLADETGQAAPAGPGYPVLSALFEELEAAADPAIRLDGAGYGTLFDRLAAETPVRGPHRSHPRIKILGLLEARLIAADRLILAGLDEAIWPPQVRTDPFLNRPMRAALGLSAPERRIGRTAHDFEMALGAPEVVLTRAEKRGGSPTVPSRFLQRLAAVSAGAWSICARRGRTTLDLARALDRVEKPCPIGRPCPRPAVALRPRSLSVTRIEVLRRDPYSIYAERILRLRPREPLTALIGPRELGTVFHGAMKAFSETTPPPPDAAAWLLDRLGADLAEALTDPAFRAFAWPRLGRWSRAFATWESLRRGGIAQLLVERKGMLPLKLADGSVFELTAEADRIEIGAGGIVTVVDFKTGVPPSAREVRAGFAPQLTLEAAMARRGAFGPLAGNAARFEALYVRFANADEVKEIALDWKGDPPFSDVVETHHDELVALLNDFRREERGYLARPFPKYALRHDTYDHLSRVREWSATGGAGSGAAE